MVLNRATLIPVGLGIISVLQAGLNRKIASNIGLAAATALNNAVLFLASLVFLVWVKGATGRDIMMPSNGNASLPVYFWIVPGLLGLLLVAGIPASISRLGAVQVFIPLITSQVLASVLWDFAFEGRRLGSLQLIGSVLVLVGVGLITGKE